MKNRGMFICVGMGLIACAVMGTMALAATDTPYRVGAAQRSTPFHAQGGAAAQQTVQNPAQAPAKTPAPLAGVPGAGPNAPPTPEEKRLAASISAYATAQCGGKDSAAAPDCWAKALWDATQCPPEDAADKSATAASQPCVAGGPGFEYDVASIKPHGNDGMNGSMVNSMPDGYRAVNVTMQNTVINAYSMGLQMQITGGPGWFNDLRFDIEAKFTPEVVDAMKKLSQDDRGFVRRYMMQKVLKERANLAAHVDTKEVPAYDLVIGKNGPKLKEADPNSKDFGMMRIMPTDQGRLSITGKGMKMINLARNLSGPAGRPVFDKTGLTGSYDITLEFVPERMNGMGPAAVPGGGAGAVPDATDPGGPTIMAALEEQLGLKLVSSRGPMQVVVIEHIDKPDVN